MKRIKTLLLSVIFISLLTSCKPAEDVFASDGVAPEKESKPVSEITAAIIEGGDFPEMTAKTADDLEYKYGLDADGVVEASFYVNPAGTNPDEIVVLKMASADKAAEAAEFFEKYAQERLKSWRDYLPAEVYKLENAVIETNGDYVVMFICGDGEKAKEIFEESV
ncbi:MAG: DUF4358 domain-containing protein [Oscillospiraceae bacterium]|jgi:hypothetical protein|nr:DUF4358 domain-containing protein [Oscillospiraceae bacterium]